jgi:hypothetical protein
MNTHKTPKTPQSYQEMPNKVVKKVLQNGTYFRGGRITNQELQTSSKQLQHEKTNRFFWRILWMLNGTISWTTPWFELEW